MNIKITHAMVLLRPHHPDTVTLTTDLPLATFPHEGNQFLTFNAEAGKGVEYVKTQLGIEPEIVDLNEKQDAKLGQSQIYSVHDAKGKK